MLIRLYIFKQLIKTCMKKNKPIWMRYVAAITALLTMSLNAYAEDIYLTHAAKTENQVTITDGEDGVMTVVSQGGDPFFQLTPLGSVEKQG